MVWQENGEMLWHFEPDSKMNPLPVCEISTPSNPQELHFFKDSNPPLTKMREKCELVLAPFLCSHLWFLPGWRLLTSSPSHYKKTFQGLSYLLYVQAADELTRWLLDWQTHSLTAWLAERQAYQNPASLYLKAAGHLKQKQLFICRFTACGWSSLTYLSTGQSSGLMESPAVCPWSPTVCSPASC